MNQQQNITIKTYRAKGLKVKLTIPERVNKLTKKKQELREAWGNSIIRDCEKGFDKCKVCQLHLILSQF